MKDSGKRSKTHHPQHDHKHPGNDQKGHKHPEPGRHGHHPEEDHDHPFGHEHGDQPPFIPPLKPGDPGPDALQKITGKVPAVYLHKGRIHPDVRSVSNPAPNGSFGYLGRFITLDVPDGKTFPAGSLVISLDRKHFGSVAEESLRLFRWFPDKKRYQLVPQSGLGQTRNYIWGKISDPGLYAVIGVNADPLVLRTLVLMKQFHDLIHTVDEPTRKQLHKKICDLFIRNPQLQKAVQNPETARRLVEDNLRIGLPGKWAGGVPPKKSTKEWQKLSDICSSPEFPKQPPEADLIELQMTAAEDAGSWQVLALGLQGSQILAVHAAMLCTGKVLYFTGNEHDQNQNETGDVDHTRLWDPATNNIQTVGSPTHDLFCAGHAFLGNGKLLAAGGTQEWATVPHPVHVGHFRGLRNATIFDPKFPGGSNPWTATTSMRTERGKSTGGGRWYPTLLTLQNGQVFTMSGHPEKTDTRHNNIMIEFYKGGTWLDKGDKADAPHNYPRLHLLPNGKVFSSTPMSGQTQTWDPVSNAWANVAPSAGVDYEAFFASSILLPLLPETNYRAKILVVGGTDPKIIDLGAVTPTWQNTAPRALPGSPRRRHVLSVLLPDGNVLVTGGTETSVDADAVLTTELYKPATDQWLTLAISAVPRLYHGVALLLPDGRVWTCGSNFDCKSGLPNRELRMEVFSPPYLFQGPRPKITSAPKMVNVSNTPTFVIQTPDAAQIASVNIIRCGSFTHCFDSDQRFVKLEIQSSTANSITVASPPNGKVAPRGFYMLFLVNNNGIPSVGSFLKIKSK